jgi:hypothetical protein
MLLTKYRLNSSRLAENRYYHFSIFWGTVVLFLAMSGRNPMIWPGADRMMDEPRLLAAPRRALSECSAQCSYRGHGFER